MPDCKENNTRNFSFVRGDTFTLSVTYRTKVGPIPLVTPINIYMTVKERPTDADPGKFQLTIGSGVTITSVPLGKFSRTIPTASSMSLLCERAYFYDVVVELGTSRDTVLKGTLVLKQNITDA